MSSCRLNLHIGGTQSYYPLQFVSNAVFDKRLGLQAPAQTRILSVFSC